MSILYSLISKDKDVVLTEYTEYSGNFQQITRALLRKVHQNTKYTIDYDKYKYHYINEDNITYLCMTEMFPDDLAFAFLDDLRKKFIQTYDYEKIASFYSYQLTEFDKVISQLISYYNTCPQKNQSGEIIKELIDAKNIAIENIEKVIGRDEKLNIIAVKSESLNNQSRNINYIAQQIKKQARMKQIKTMIIVTVTIIVIVLLFIFMIF